MNYLIVPDKTIPEVYISRFATSEQASKEAERICVQYGVRVQVFELIAAFTPTAEKEVMK